MDELVRLRDELAHLRIAMETRATIEQAKGILMSRYGIDDDLAFSVLRRWSMTANLKVRDLALALVDITAVSAARNSVDRRAVSAVLAELAAVPSHAAC